MKKINWKKEARLLPGYLIVCVWVLFTAVMLFWILGASLSTSREIFSGNVFKFESGFHFENYVTAWQAQNVSVFFGNSLIYSVISCVGVLAIAAPAAYVLSRWQFRGGTALRIGLVQRFGRPARQRSDAGRKPQADWRSVGQSVKAYFGGAHDEDEYPDD